MGVEYRGVEIGWSADGCEGYVCVRVFAFALLCNDG